MSKDRPDHCADDGVYHRVVKEPGSPVGKTAHAHHLHAFLSALLFLFHDSVGNSVHHRDVDQHNKPPEQQVE
jgi:hypothetical protein